MKIEVNLKRKSIRYDIIVGKNNLKSIGSYISNLSLGNSAFIISNPKIYNLYGNIVENSLKKSGISDTEKYLVPDGEKYKNTNEYIKILNKLANFDNTLTKDIFIINLGGGVIGDLGGFVAGTYRRGVPYVQIPTTLLAFVDSGVGGKVGIDLKVGNNLVKNTVGVFHQPSLVFGDISVLATIPKEELVFGLSEVIKYGIIADKNLFEFVESNYKKILNLDLKCLLYVIEKSYRIKVDIIEKDEFDKKGVRAKLNFGHTLGHAIESASKFKLRHGEAVSIGIISACMIAEEIRMFDKKNTDRVERLLRIVGLPTRIKYSSQSNIFDALSHDKKFKHGENRFILPVELGKVKIVSGIDNNIIKKTIVKLLI